MKIFTLLTAIFLLQNCTAQKLKPLEKNADDNSLLWEISGKGLKKPSYLFGTFHMLCKEDIHISTNLQQAIKDAGEVYFEMDLDDPKNTLGAMFFMNMKNNKTLKDLYSEAEYEKVKKYFSDTLKMNISLLNKMKPMMLEALLYPRMMPCKSPSGVEIELMSIAKKQKKQIKGFETIEFQSAIFDSIPYEVQAKALLKDIDSTEKYKVYFNKMVNTYKKQQMDSLNKMVSDTTFSGGENDDALLKNRNENWVKQLDSILKQNNIFIAVGAAHLIGKNGLIALLKKAGYKMRPIENVK
jgi:uncharacterized protein